MDSIARIAAYCRISIDEEIGKDNTSIENQKSIISKFINENFPDNPVDFFEDRDRSGYSFEQREGYQEMRKGFFNGKYRILIIKDLSRFARRNSYGLCELECLRDAGIRIISVNEGIDYPTDDEWMRIQFSFLMNEMPVTDASKKVRKVIENRQKDGKWICAVPYGYIMLDSKAMTFDVNEKQAEAVKLIFELYNSGMGFKAIAKKLTNMKIPTARQDAIVRMESAGKDTRLKSNNKWSVETVRQILRNDFYIGTLRQRKYARQKINGADIEQPLDSQIIIPDHHTSIISESLFNQVQEQLSIRAKAGYRGIKKYRNDYTGYLFCGDCKRPMSTMSRADLAPAYRCSTYQKHGKANCTSHHIRVDKLDDTLKKYISNLIENSHLISDKIDLLLNERNKSENTANTIDSANEIHHQIKQFKSELAAATTQRVKDIMKKPEREELINETYDMIISDISNKIDGLNSQLELLDKRETAVKKIHQAVLTTDRVLGELLEKERLDKSDIGNIVNRIEIFDDHVEVHLKADIDAVINAEAEAETPHNLIDTSFEGSVTVISEGDPLEIYTSADGEVIFKKYSAINEMANSASQVAEVMTRLANCPTVVFDRDHVVAVAGVQKKEFSERRVSRALEEYLESRKNYIRSSSADAKVFPVEGVDQAALACSPILASGDVTGAVAFLAPNDSAVANEVQQNLIQAAAQFLGKQIED